jgi:hypothetical protein
MADKSTIEAIGKLVAARPRELLNIIDGEMLLQQNFEGTRDPLVKGLRFLVEDFRKQAELVMDSGARGRGAEATALRSTASTLSLLAAEVATVDLDEPTPPAGAVPVQWCTSTDEHGPHPHEREAERAGEIVRLQFQCDGHHERDLSGLDALVADRAAAERMTIDPAVGPDFTGGAFTALFAEPGLPGDPAAVHAPEEPDDAGDGDGQEPSMPVLDAPSVDESARMRAYLAGETDVFPGDAPEPSPLAGVDWPAHRTERGPVTDPEILEAAKVLEPVPASMFVEPMQGRTYGAEPVIPGRRLTFAELRQAPPIAPIAHTSNSQVTQMNDCGLQARLSRYEPGVIERPQWHLVGGKAVHRVAEEFERLVLEVKNPQYVKDRVKLAGGAAGLWKAAFNAEIIAQSIACPQVPQDDWRASGRGHAEGYTWWLTQGVDMVQRYLDLRMAELASAPDRVIMGANGGAPMIEHEGVLDVEGTPHKIVIDQVWRWGPAMLMINDLKSGANAPRGGTFQLAQYAWYLRMTLGYEGKIYGQYWDARKGTYSAPVDLIELHPWDEIVWRIKDAQAKKEAGLFGANPGPFCGGCAVKHACPVVSRG